MLGKKKTPLTEIIRIHAKWICSRSDAALCIIVESNFIWIKNRTRTEKGLIKLIFTKCNDKDMIGSVITSADECLQ